MTSLAIASLATVQRFLVGVVLGTLFVIMLIERSSAMSTLGGMRLPVTNCAPQPQWPPRHSSPPAQPLLSAQGAPVCVGLHIPSIVQYAAPPHSAWLGCVQPTFSWHFISVRLQISPVKHSTVRMHMRPEPPASIPASPPPVTLPLHAATRTRARTDRSQVISRFSRRLDAHIKVGVVAGQPTQTRNSSSCAGIGSIDPSRASKGPRGALGAPRNT